MNSLVNLLFIILPLCNIKSILLQLLDIGIIGNNIFNVALSSCSILGNSCLEPIDNSILVINLDRCPITRLGIVKVLSKLVEGTCVSSIYLLGLLCPVLLNILNESLIKDSLLLVVVLYVIRNISDHLTQLFTNIVDLVLINRISLGRFPFTGCL